MQAKLCLSTIIGSQKKCGHIVFVVIPGVVTSPCDRSTIRAFEEAKHIWHTQGLHNAKHQELTQGHLADILLWDKHILLAMALARHSADGKAVCHKAVCHKAICRCPMWQVTMGNKPVRNSQGLTHAFAKQLKVTQNRHHKSKLPSQSPIRIKFGLYQLLQGMGYSSCCVYGITF